MDRDERDQCEHTQAVPADGQLGPTVPCRLDDIPPLPGPRSAASAQAPPDAVFCRTTGLVPCGRASWLHVWEATVKRHGVEAADDRDSARSRFAPRILGQVRSPLRRHARRELRPGPYGRLGCALPRIADRSNGQLLALAGGPGTSARAPAAAKHLTQAPAISQIRL